MNVSSHSARAHLQLTPFPVRPIPKRGGISVRQMALYRYQKILAQERRSQVSDLIYAASEPVLLKP